MDSVTVSPDFGGTGVSNVGTITVGGNSELSGAYTFKGTLTGNTEVTFPTSGTLATTSSASGVVNSGTADQLAYYATTGNAVSGLTGPLPVTMGGSGVVTNTTPYGVLCAGGTADGPIQTASTGQGTSGYVLTSTGSSSLPEWQAVGSGSSGEGAKFWLKASGDGTTILDSFNVTSITDSGIGTLTVTIGTDFSSASWCFHVSAQTGASLGYIPLGNGQTAGTLVVVFANVASATLDPGSWHVSGFGDQ